MFVSDAEVGGVQIPPYFLCKDVEFLVLQSQEEIRQGTFFYRPSYTEGMAH